MTARRLAFCFLLAAGLTCAQDTAQLEIRGTVVEGALGIGGVTVTLFDTPAEATTPSVVATTFTDTKGQFTIHPTRAGAYYVEVKKEGYFADSYNGTTRDPADSTGDPVSIDADHPLRERKYSLMRLREVRGRVIDEDGNPLVKLNVVIQTPASSLFREFVQTATDQDGTFAATKLRPGDYQVRILPEHRLDVLSQFTEDDLKIFDQDWDTSAWPAVPLPVGSGSSLSVGTITARKAKYYRAHLSVDLGDCAAGEMWTFSATSAGADTGFAVPCGKEFLARYLAPGSYTFTFATSGRPEERKLAFASVEVIDRNLESGLTLSSGADINGQLKAAEGATFPSGKIMIRIDPMIPLNGSQMIAPDPAGKFLIRGVTAVRQHVSVVGLASKFYVQEIRYNGLIIADNIFTPISGAPGLLDIVIDDQAAIISGTVAERDKVTERVMVAAVRWPLHPEAKSLVELLGSSASVSADAQGRFQIGGLAPGDYRVLALTPDVLIRNGDNLIRLVNDAEKVTVERGSLKDIALKLIDPSQ